jgi:hypothetical protein
VKLEKYLCPAGHFADERCGLWVAGMALMVADLLETATDAAGNGTSFL